MDFGIASLLRVCSSIYARVYTRRMCHVHKLDVMDIHQTDIHVAAWRWSCSRKLISAYMY